MAKRIVVTGKPGSGKTTYVEALRKPGDLVWDADAIANTLAKERQFPRSSHVASILHDLFECMVRWLIASPPTNAYIIVTDDAQARAIATRLSAQIHRCDYRDTQNQPKTEEMPAWG